MTALSIRFGVFAFLMASLTVRCVLAQPNGA